MAMIKCPECEGSISDKAVFCPHCGYPISANPFEPTYELEKGKTYGSGFSTFLKILAWLTWIGGLIISIAGANVSVSSYSTEFSFTVFLTLFVPFVIYGALLYGMANLVQDVANTYHMVNGMTLVIKKPHTPVGIRTISANPVKKESEGTGQSAPQASDETGADFIPWVDDENPLFIRCPKCGKRASRDFMQYKSACVQCGCPYQAPQ